jgi:tetratricopeptide (TPR) repeat protein
VNYRPHTTYAAVSLMMLLLMVSSSSAQTSVDRIRRHNGVDSGKITSVTPLEITIAKGTVESKVPSENVESVTFAGEPQELAAARNALQAGRPQEAVDALTKLPPDNSRREEIAADIDFYTAAAKAQLALAGQGTPDAAATEVRNFMARRGKSFHIPQAIELVGDLQMAAGQYGDARAEYAKLAKARSPYYLLKSALLVGRTWQAEGDHAKAQAEFDKIVASREQGPLIEQLKLGATLEGAVSQAAAGKINEAAAAIGQIIAKAEPEDDELQARAYNALGDCYLKSGDNRAALFAFLHVDLLYNQEAEAHAKALSELTKLWKAVGRDSRAQEAAQQLAEKYPNTRWARQ